jgi:lipopolysaccharide transport system ATP-binding protein
MTDLAIYAEALSKRYHIGKLQTKQDTLFSQINASIRSSIRQTMRLLRSRSADHGDPDEVIWALDDVSFEVKKGEVLGIIGRNGAGKSTLLKILSRITEPTRGFADVYGRVGSLLEVGTGFHPELTGRENIYLNGAILGMRKAEIDRKFEEIVEFAEIRKFIDTPVKHYSSGMYVRLAFAVAAHLEPEILLVDEVLAVGDLAFQKKCLGKMGDVTKQGRTVLFVSHNMAAIKNHCNRAIWLLEGRIHRIGEVNEVVRGYEKEILTANQDGSQMFPLINKEYGLSLEGVNVSLMGEEPDSALKIDVLLNSNRKITRLGIGVRIATSEGVLVASLPPRLTRNQIDAVDGRVCCTLECEHIHQYLAGGEYLVELEIVLPGAAKLIETGQFTSFRIPEMDHFGSGYYFSLKTNGIVPIPLRIKEVISLK